MSYEPTLVTTLAGIIGDVSRVFPDAATTDPAVPYAVYQQVGGQAFNFLEIAPTGLRHADVLVSIWSTTRKEVNTLMRAAEDALMASAIKAAPVSAFTAVFDDQTRLYGAQQNFSVFFA